MNTIKTVHLPGYRIGLTVAIDANLEDYAASTGRSNGFKVKLVFLDLQWLEHFIWILQ